MSKKLDSDINSEKYQELLSDNKWYELHKGEYVAIIDKGRVVKTCADKSKLLKNIQRYYRHSSRSIYLIDREEEPPFEMGGG